MCEGNVKYERTFKVGNVKELSAYKLRWSFSVKEHVYFIHSSNLLSYDPRPYNMKDQLVAFFRKTLASFFIQRSGLFVFGLMKS